MKQKSIFEIVELAKILNFLVESDSEYGYIFIRPLQESECYTNINYHEILLKTHWFVKFEKIEDFGRVLQVFEFSKRSKIW